MGATDMLLLAVMIRRISADGQSLTLQIRRRSRIRRVCIP